LEATAVLSWPSVERSPGPLSGIRVLDLSRVLAGPYATMLLADLGADVIKVEHPDGDEPRRWGPPFLGGTAVYHLAMNRNKRSLRLDLKDPDDCSVARQLAANADVIVENFRPGSLAAFSLDADSVRVDNPGCVYCTISAFGSDSELRMRPGYDLVVQAMGGIMGVTGEPGRPPVKVGVPNADLAAGMYATVAVLAALFQREHERENKAPGRNVEVALLDAQVAFLANQSMNWLAGGMDPQPLGSDHPNVAPYGAFETGTGFIVVAVGNDKHFRQLCAAVGRPAWAEDPRFASNGLRVQHREVLRAELTNVLKASPSAYWLDTLTASGVACGPVRSISEVFADPLVTERMVRTVPDPVVGEVPQVLSPFRFDGKSSPIDLPPPSLGSHDDDIRAHFELPSRHDAAALEVDDG
jgi:crotonobetainyl-CoA:carnitine CoA-transferase CaiB-like acyl-CoA transferase